MKVLVACAMEPTALETLRREHDVVVAHDADPAELRRRIADREAMVFRSGIQISANLLRGAPDLRLIVRAGSGFDNVDLDEVARRGIELVRIPEPGAQAVAELTFGLMLALARRIVFADAQWRQGRWVKHEIEGWLLRGKVLGIVGAGNVGARVGQLGVALGMRAVGCVASPTPAAAVRLADRGIRLAPFDEVVAAADFLTVHVPLNDATRNLVDAGVLARLKPRCFLVNMARGGVVDERALLLALQRGGPPRGAALDVHEAEGEGCVSPLAGLPNVVLTPHLGSATVDTQLEIGERVVGVIRAFALRGPDALREAAAVPGSEARPRPDAMRGPDAISGSDPLSAG